MNNTNTNNRSLSPNATKVAELVGINLQELDSYIQIISEDQFHTVNKALELALKLKKKMKENELNRAYGHEFHPSEMEQEAPVRDDMIAPKIEVITDAEALADCKRRKAKAKAKKLTDFCKSECYKELCYTVKLVLHIFEMTTEEKRKVMQHDEHYDIRYDIKNEELYNNPVTIAYTNYSIKQLNYLYRLIFDRLEEYDKKISDGISNNYRLLERYLIELSLRTVSKKIEIAERQA